MYERFWQLGTEIYGGYPLYQQRVGNRHIPVFVRTSTDAQAIEGRLQNISSDVNGRSRICPFALFV